MVSKCYTAFKIVSIGIMARFIKLDVLFCLIDLGLRPHGEFAPNEFAPRAMIISNEVQIPFHFMHFRISSVINTIRLRAIIISNSNHLAFRWNLQFYNVVNITEWSFIAIVTQRS